MLAALHLGQKAENRYETRKIKLSSGILYFFQANFGDGMDACKAKQMFSSIFIVILSIDIWPVES